MMPKVTQKKIFKLIYNPSSGNAQPRKSFINIINKQFSKQKSYAKQNPIDIIKNEFKNNNSRLDISILKKDESIESIIQACDLNNYTAIIIAGGDGTINTAINALHHSDIPIGILPIGSVNILAISLNIPFDLKKACQKIIFGVPKKIDVGKINDSLFACMVGIGFDAHVINKTPSKLKKICGLLSYTLIYFKELFKYSFPPIEYTLNNSTITHSAYALVITNTPFYGGNFKINNNIQIDDEKLHIIALKQNTILHYLRFTWHVMNESLHKYSWVETTPINSISTKKNQAHDTHIDAEYIGKCHANISVLPKTLSIIH